MIVLLVEFGVLLALRERQRACVGACVRMTLCVCVRMYGVCVCVCVCVLEQFE